MFGSVLLIILHFPAMPWQRNTAFQCSLYWLCPTQSAILKNPDRFRYTASSPLQRSSISGCRTDLSSHPNRLRREWVRRISLFRNPKRRRSIALEWPLFDVVLTFSLNPAPIGGAQRSGAKTISNRRVTRRPVQHCAERFVRDARS